MACLNCKSSVVRNSVNILECSKCGLYQVSSVTMSIGGQIGSAGRKQIEMDLLCSELGIEESEEAKKIMRSAYVQIQRGYYTNEELAVVSLYIYQRMNNRVVNLKQLCDIMGVSRKRARNILARTEDYFDVNLTYTLEEARSFCKTNGYDVMDIVEKVDGQLQITRNILAACVYLGTNLSYKQVAERFYTSKKSVINYTRKVEELI